MSRSGDRLDEPESVKLREADGLEIESDESERLSGDLPHTPGGGALGSDLFDTNGPGSNAPGTVDDLFKTSAPGSSQGEKASGPVDPLVGTVFAEKFEVLSLLGQGGMSSVYKVKNVHLREIQALKVLHKHLWSDPLAVERFRMEAQAVHNLSHKNLITFRDFGVSTDGQPYLIMDYLQGRSLSDAIKEEHGLPVDMVLTLFESICHGLKAAHDGGIVHRDLKPANVMLEDDNPQNAKLVDFGIAKIVAEDSPTMQLTQTGEVFGSPLYMSPEQVQGEKVDRRTDIYSAGCLIYEAITGVPPISGMNALDTMNNQISQIPRRPGELRPDIYQSPASSSINVRDLEYIVMRCLEKERTDRYESFDQIMSDLSKVRSNVSITGKVLPTRVKKKIAFLSVGLVFCTLLGGLAAGYVFDNRIKGAVDNSAIQALETTKLGFGDIAFNTRRTGDAENIYKDVLNDSEKVSDPAAKRQLKLGALKRLETLYQFNSDYNSKDKIQQMIRSELSSELGNMTNFETEQPSASVAEIEGLDELPPNTQAKLLSTLAMKELSNGRSKAAGEYLEKALAVQKDQLDKALDKDSGINETERHDTIARNVILLDKLATAYVIQRKYHKAGHTWHDALRMGEKWLPEDDEAMANVWDNIGRIRQDHKQMDGARAAFNHAIKISKKVYGEKAPNTLKYLRDYASFLTAVGETSEAEKILRQVQKMEGK